MHKYILMKNAFPYCRDFFFSLVPLAVGVGLRKKAEVPVIVKNQKEKVVVMAVKM